MTYSRFRDFRFYFPFLIYRPNTRITPVVAGLAIRSTYNFTFLPFVVKLTFNSCLITRHSRVLLFATSSSRTFLIAPFIVTARFALFRYRVFKNTLEILYRQHKIPFTFSKKILNEHDDIVSVS